MPLDTKINYCKQNLIKKRFKFHLQKVRTYGKLTETVKRRNVHHIYDLSKYKTLQRFDNANIV